MKVSFHSAQATDNPSGCDSQHEGGGRNTEEIFSHRTRAKVSAAAAFTCSIMTVQNVSGVGWLELRMKSKEGITDINREGKGPRGSPAVWVINQ